MAYKDFNGANLDEGSIKQLMRLYALNRGTATCGFDYANCQTIEHGVRKGSREWFAVELAQVPEERRVELWRGFISRQTSVYQTSPAKVTRTDVDFSEFDTTDAPETLADSVEPAPVAAPTKPPRTAAAPGSFDALIDARIAEAINAGETGVDEKAVRAIAESVVEAARLPRPIHVTTNDKPAVEITERVHPLFEKVLKLAARGVNVLMVGPAGCGKTSLAAQVARALGREFGSISYSAGASESWLLGRSTPNLTTGENVYSPVAFTRLYGQPSVFLHDELDAADPNMTLVINSALANGGFDNPVSGTRMTRHADAVQLGSANTFGTGADAKYVGRNQLDAATLDRWYVVHMDYDTELEREIAGQHGNVLQFVWNLRANVASKGIFRTVSTRMIQRGVQGLEAGLSWGEVKSDLTAGWTADELSACGLAK